MIKRPVVLASNITSLLDIDHASKKRILKELIALKKERDELSKKKKRTPVEETALFNIELEIGYLENIYEGVF
jgi:hypothetical protein